MFLQNCRCSYSLSITFPIPSKVSQPSDFSPILYHLPSLPLTYPSLSPTPRPCVRPRPPPPEDASFQVITTVPAEPAFAHIPLLDRFNQMTAWPAAPDSGGIAYLVAATPQSAGWWRRWTSADWLGFLDFIDRRLVQCSSNGYDFGTRVSFVTDGRCLACRYDLTDELRTQTDTR